MTAAVPDAATIVGWCGELAAVTSTPGSITRVYLSPEHERVNTMVARWMQDAGVRLALGSDAPVSPLDPWLAMAAAVHRSADEREPWHAEQALTLAEALAASVDGQGAAHVGMPGDLIALDTNPLVVQGNSADQAAALRSIRSVLTVIDGRVAHTDL